MGKVIHAPYHPLHPQIIISLKLPSYYNFSLTKSHGNVNYAILANFSHQIILMKLHHAILGM
jgi:hypothetical protein